MLVGGFPETTCKNLKILHTHSNNMKPHIITSNSSYLSNQMFPYQTKYFILFQTTSFLSNGRLCPLSCSFYMDPDGVAEEQYS